jgi:hypothetical protein
MKTDLLIGDGTSFYRTQIKTFKSNDESHCVENKCGDAIIDYVIYFSRTVNWDYIVKQFSQAKKRLNGPDNFKFHQHPKPFMKAFYKI